VGRFTAPDNPLKTCFVVGRFCRGEAGKNSTGSAAPMTAMAIAARMKTLLNEL
jgi:hypothetical protein